MAIARECERGERQELAHHLIATLGVALMCDARQLPYPPSLLSPPMLSLWRAALRHGPASWEQRLRELLPRLPAALGQALDQAPDHTRDQAPEPAHESAHDPHELYHPRTGEAVMFLAREGWTQLIGLRPWLGELEGFESDERSIGSLVASAQVRGLRPVPKREPPRPEATQHAAGPTSACVNPRDGSLWAIHGGALRRYDPSGERGHEIMACAQARCLGWAPDGSQLAVSDRSIVLLRPSDGRQLELSWPTGTRRAAWSPDSRTLAALPEVDPTRAHLDLDPSVPRTRLPSLVIYDAEHGRLRLERDERQAQRLVFMSPERLLLLSPSRVASVLSLAPGSTPRPGPWLGDGVEHARWIEGGLLMPGPAGELLHLREDPQQGDLVAYGDQHLVAPRWTAKPDHLQLMSLIYDAPPDQGWVLLGTLARGTEQPPALALYDLRRGVALACWRPPRDEAMWGQIMLSADLRRVFYAGADGLWSHALDLDALNGSCFGMVERGVALRPARSAWPGQPRVVEALRGELWSLEELRRSAPDRVRLPSWP